MADHRILGVILAGGASRRFGADKAAALLAGRPLLVRVAERAAPQVDRLLINANDSVPGACAAGLALLADTAPGQGPIAGILAALAEAEATGFSQAASFACDTPFLPADTVARLAAALAMGTADYALARCNGAPHRIFALWPLACRARLEDAFADGIRSMRGIETWLTPAFADFAGENGPGGDPFFNINTQADLQTAERWICANARFCTNTNLYTD